MSDYDFVDSFRNRLDLAMRERDISAAELSRRSGLSDGLISGYRTGRQEPKREKLALLAKALNVSPVWLMGFDVPMIDIKLSDSAPSIKEAVNDFTQEKGKLALEAAKKEWAKKYLTLDSMDVLTAYHNATPEIKNVVRKILDLPAYTEKNAASIS